MARFQVSRGDVHLADVETYEEVLDLAYSRLTSAKTRKQLFPNSSGQQPGGWWIEGPDSYADPIVVQTEGGRLPEEFHQGWAHPWFQVDEPRPARIQGGVRSTSR